MRHKLCTMFSLNPLEGSMISRWHFVHDWAYFSYYIWKSYHNRRANHFSCLLYHALAHDVLKSGFGSSYYIWSFIGSSIFAWDRRTTPIVHTTTSNVCNFHTPQVSILCTFIVRLEHLQKPSKLNSSCKLEMKSMLHTYKEETWELQHTSRAFNTSLMRSKKHKRGAMVTWSCDRLHKCLVAMFHIGQSNMWLKGLLKLM